MLRLLTALILALSLGAAEGTTPELLVPRTSLGELGTAAAYRPADEFIDLDISEYAGYGGLIVANGGLEGSADSFLAKTYKLRLRLRLSESENWRQLNEGSFAATVTTADVLALLGPRMKVAVPVLMSYSRGADGIVAREGLHTINDLRGKAVAVSQFNESEFLLRYLATEADVAVQALPTPDAPLRADAINLVFAADGFAAGDRLLHELTTGGRLAACVTWAPKTDEVVKGSAGKAHILTTNRNLLVIADVLLVNAGFAKARPEIVRAIVHGVLEGNRLLRDDRERHLPTVATAFDWEAAEASEELAKVHLANHAENLAFFGGTMDAAGSFTYIMQSANLVYADYRAEPVDPATLADITALKSLADSFPNEQLTIRPLGVGDRALEPATVVTRDIRFLFEPNSSKLNTTSQDNAANLDRLANWLRTSPGSVLQLIGHVEPSMRVKERQRLGRERADADALKLGEDRALAVRQALLSRLGGAGDRIVQQSRGWDEPIPGESDIAKNRRVEVRWQMLE